MRLGNRKSAGFNRDWVIHPITACRVGSVISNWTGRRVFCWSTSARVAMIWPWQTSRTRSCIKSQARSLLSIAKLNKARSRHRLAICNRTRIAQISLSLNGVFWPTSLPLFQGSRVILAGFTDSMAEVLVLLGQVCALTGRSSVGDLNYCIYVYTLSRWASASMPRKTPGISRRGESHLSARSRLNGTAH
jgi:hypothetical protein